MKNNKGFTLMELMIGATILVIALVGLLAAYTGCFNLNQTAGNLTIAMNGAQGEMERIRNLAFDLIDNENGNSFDPVLIAGIPDVNFEGIVEVNNSAPDLLMVTVTVSWTRKDGRQLSEQVVTLISNR